MKWINGYTWGEKKRRKEEWHKWFAWHPVTVSVNEEQRKVKVWLERVERKGRYYCTPLSEWWDWEYREIRNG